MAANAARLNQSRDVAVNRPAVTSQTSYFRVYSLSWVTPQGPSTTHTITRLSRTIASETEQSPNFTDPANQVSASIERSRWITEPQAFDTLSITKIPPEANAMSHQLPVSVAP